MRCTKCSNEIIENQVLGNKFFYCRICKIEVASPLPDWEGQEVSILNSIPRTNSPQVNIILGRIYTNTFRQHVIDVISLPMYSTNNLNIPLSFPTPGSRLYTPASPQFSTNYILNIPRNPVTNHIEDWICPHKIKPHDNFHGIDRNIDIANLSGIYNQVITTIYDAILDTSTSITLHGGIVDHVYLSVKNFEQLEKDLNITSNLKSNPYIHITSYYNRLFIYPDTTISDKEIYLVQKDTWRFDTTFNALYCTNPGFNAVIIL